ncbi:MAG: pyrroloquinoline quinone biosynthesis protein PqqE [Candidatus Methanofastidiosum methylothiophilum]|uniref:Pyrroloquinoline quinone biosynthesis protein PqqE n=1 Tax=Candidatus Methanofastidiosum methylothiophilum TaxID=1705564 RepID=A0A150IHC8_9EURY|nr:MAG: pyrroloquinoline quinone biosynthesis protein PqqE [Candidatus Methanofastidiosum methylthiophilus]KYC48274.1 MAG: pyrroloquinoline quinone biosynthesis protein PqqE [Candidatus Methanofastidiosum methylthiophilus]KYC50931.1 MAG: pyrroloquinoline quinone biosynthesis protein PqqE [Candidatus Methanofastidiosum methylthiophilus]
MKSYFDKGRLYTLQLEICNICPQECNYCYTKLEGNLGNVVPKSKIIEIIDDASTLGAKRIEWLGGDPICHPDWEELLKYAHDLGIKNNIWSSGYYFKDKGVSKKAIKLTEEGIISVHFDSITRPIYEKLHSNDFNEFRINLLEGLRTLIDLGKDPNDIYNCVTLTNLQTKGDYKETSEYFKHNFGIKTTFVVYKPVYSGFEFAPAPEEVRAASVVKNKINGSDMSPIPQCVDRYYCGTTMSVTNNLHLTPCSRIRQSFGNINSRRFIDCFKENFEMLLKIPLRDLDNLPKCKNCERNTDCWGCRGNAWHYQSDVLGMDSKCWR